MAKKIDVPGGEIQPPNLSSISAKVKEIQGLMKSLRVEPYVDAGVVLNMVEIVTESLEEISNMLNTRYAALEKVTQSLLEVEQTVEQLQKDMKKLKGGQ